MNRVHEGKFAELPDAYLHPPLHVLMATVTYMNQQNETVQYRYRASTHADIKNNKTLIIPCPFLR